MFGYFGLRALRDWWNRPVIEEMERDRMALQDDVRALQGIVGTIVTDLDNYITAHGTSALQSQINDLTKANGDLKSANDTLVSTNSDLAAKVEADDASVQAAKDAEKQAEDAKTASDNALSALQTTVDQSDEAIQSLKQTLADADARLQAVPATGGAGGTGTPAGTGGTPPDTGGGTGTGTPEGPGEPATGGVIPVPEPPPADLHR